MRVHNIDHSLWFDGNGLRIARGHDTRTPRAAVLTYEDAANRISTLLKTAGMRQRLNLQMPSRTNIVNLHRKSGTPITI